MTFVTVKKSICLAIGAAPEAVDDPYHLTQLILASLDRLARPVPGKKTVCATRRKKS